MKDAWLSVAESAKLAGVSKSTIYLAKDQGKIKCKSLASGIFVCLRSSVLAFAAARKATVGTGATATPIAVDADLWALCGPAAELVGTTKNWVWRLAAKGIIRRRIVDGTYQFSVDDLRRYFKVVSAQSNQNDAEPMPPLVARLHGIIEVCLKLRAYPPAKAYELIKETVDK
jgi:hypothetical protein